MTIEQQQPETDPAGVPEGYRMLTDAEHLVVLQTRHDNAEKEGIFNEADRMRKLIGDLKWTAAVGSGDGTLVIHPDTHEVVGELPPHPEGPWYVAPVAEPTGYATDPEGNSTWPLPPAPEPLPEGVSAENVAGVLDALSGPIPGFDADLGALAMRVADRGVTALLVAMYDTGNLGEILRSADSDSVEFWLSSVLRNVRRLTGPAF